MTTTTQVQGTNQVNPTVGQLPLRTFIGFYRHRNTPPMQIYFDYRGDLKAAKERFRKHCEVMGYLYMQVTPMIMDLDKREKLRNSSDFDINIDD